MCIKKRIEKIEKRLKPEKDKTITIKVTKDGDTLPPGWNPDIIVSI
jgi:hypothetical protein